MATSRIRQRTHNNVISPCTLEKPSSQIITIETQKTRINNDAYKIDFSILYIGKFIHKSKRKIRWSFGLTPNSGQSTTDKSSRNDVHEIELIWSILSGKYILYWNKVDITNEFSKEHLYHPYSYLEFSWMTQTGEKICIKTNVMKGIGYVTDPQNTDDIHQQYHLSVNGRNFDTLQSLKDLAKDDCNIRALSCAASSIRNDTETTANDEFIISLTTSITPDSSRHDTFASGISRNNSSEVALRLNNQVSNNYKNIASNSSTISDIDDNSIIDNDERQIKAANPDSLCFRLNLAGLQHRQSDVLHDELHSDLYTTVLDSLRQQITDSLPQVEDIVSRTIINLFCKDDYNPINNNEHCNNGENKDDIFSIHSIEESLKSYLTESTLGIDPDQIEANYLYDAYQWVQKNQLQKLNIKIAKSNAVEFALDYFQKCVDEVFTLIFNVDDNSSDMNDLDIDTASRILLNIASIIGLQFAKPRLHNTLIVLGLNTNVTNGVLRTNLSTYGDIISSSIVRCDSASSRTNTKKESNYHNLNNTDQNDTNPNGSFGYVRFQNEADVDDMINLLTTCFNKTISRLGTPTFLVLTENGTKQIALKQQDAINSLDTIEVQSTGKANNVENNARSTIHQNITSFDYYQHSPLVSEIANDSDNKCEIPNSPSISVSSATIPHLMAQFGLDDDSYNITGQYNSFENYEDWNNNYSCNVPMIKYRRNASYHRDNIEYTNNINHQNQQNIPRRHTTNNPRVLQKPLAYFLHTSPVRACDMHIAA